MEARRVLVMAGGTGGHVFPALAVAEELRERGVAVTWLGTRRGVEAQLVPLNEFPIRFINISGLRGKKGLLGKLKAPWQLLTAVWQSLCVMRDVRPDAVLGLGGFASGPGGVAAWLLRVPLVIHEQNGVAGTTNRLLAKIATRVLEAFPGSLPGAEHYGNPVRKAISDLPEPEQRGVGRRESGCRVSGRRVSARRDGDGIEGRDSSSENGSGQRPHLLVLGGSLGALALNRVIPTSLSRVPLMERPEVLHQTGRDHIDVTRQGYIDAEVDANTVAFIDDMAAAYEWADLVVCRSGALTVTELTAAGLASVLVPYPHAIDDHQTANARWLVDNQAAVLIQQSALNEDDLAALLSELLSDGERLMTMAQAARGLSRPEASSDVADVCQEVMK